MRNSLRLELIQFRCGKQATVRFLPFTVDPNRPMYMRDGQGRSIRYLGILRMVVNGPRRARALALEPAGENWVIKRIAFGTQNAGASCKPP